MFRNLPRLHYKMKKLTAIAGLVIISNILLGCSCYMIQSFDLKDYDESTHIAEIKVIEKLEDDYENRLAQYEKDTMNWDKEYPPIPLAPPNDYTDFRIEIIEVFKGNLDKSVVNLRANEKNSSCYWEPEVGKSYIFYLEEVLTEDKIVEVRGCQRRIRNDSENYDSEIEGLEILGAKKDGIFKISQSSLSDNQDEPHFSIKGKFRNGKRHGKWTIAESQIYSKDQVQLGRKVLVLRFKNGYLMSVKYDKPNNKYAEHFTRHWEYYYEEKRNKHFQRQKIKSRRLH